MVIPMPDEEKRYELELTETECEIIASALRFADERDSVTTIESVRIHETRGSFTSKWADAEEVGHDAQ